MFADQKDKMEAENKKIVSNFGSLLNQRLEDLHKTIIGSISQQQKQLRCMEDHASSHLASKSEVRKKNKACFTYSFVLSFNLCLSD